MQLEDVAIEVRDWQLTRKGVINPEYMNVNVRDRFNGVGEWTLTLPSEHQMCDVLRQPGSGIIVYLKGSVVFSGPTTKPEFVETSTDAGGTMTFVGVSDSVVLGDYLAWPEPGNDNPTTAVAQADTRTDECETLMHAYVNVNMGPGAPVSRRKTDFALGTDSVRGPVVTKAPRYQKLGELLSELAVQGDLGFYVRQDGDVLKFETYGVVDRTEFIRLDVLNGTLSSAKASIVPPEVTRAIVSGEGVIGMFASLGSVAAEADWARRIERYYESNQSKTATDIQNAANEVLLQFGDTRNAAQVVANETPTMVYGEDWSMGDRVTVSIADQELTAVVTGLALQINSSGVRLGVIVGDDTSLSGSALIASQVASLSTRVSAIEREDTVAPLTYAAVLTSTQVNSTTTPAALTNHTWVVAPGKSIQIIGQMVFTAAATTTGAAIGVHVDVASGGSGTAVGSFCGSVNLSSAASATGLTDGDVYSVASSASAIVEVVGTDSTAGNNVASYQATIKNNSTANATVSVRFRSEVAASAITAQAGTGAMAFIV